VFFRPSNWIGTRGRISDLGVYERLTELSTKC
jgi:hypothetical protein